MNRKKLIGVLCLTACLALTACGNSAEQTGESKSQQVSYEAGGSAYDSAEHSESSAMLGEENVAEVSAADKDALSISNHFGMSDAEWQKYIKTDEFWVPFIKEHSVAYNQPTSDDIKVLPDGFLTDGLILDVLNGDDNWHLRSNSVESLNNTLAPKRSTGISDQLMFEYQKYYWLRVNVYNNGDTDMTLKECLENGWYYISGFFYGVEHDNTPTNDEQYESLLDELLTVLGQPNQIIVTNSTLAGHKELKSCHYSGGDNIEVNFSYVYRFEDRTLVLSILERIFFDEDFNVIKIEYQNGSEFRQFYCPNTFDFEKNRVLDTIRL